MVLTAEGVLVTANVLRTTGIDFLAAVVPGEVIAYTNVERLKAELSNVTESALLSKAAQAKAEDMARVGYFSHVGPDGKAPWSWIAEAGYTYSYAGENLAVRFTDSSQVVRAWMESPTHRANIVKTSYKEIGVGVADGVYEGRPATYVVQYFGTPKTSKSVVSIPVAQAQEVTRDSETPLQEVRGVEVAINTEEDVPATAAPVDPLSMPSRVPAEPVQSYAQILVEGVLQSDPVALWIIGGIAILLVIALILAFVVHLQVQPTDMLMSGAVVAVIAISLFAMNSAYLPTQHAPSGQAASVAGALPHGRIDTNAAMDEVLPEQDSLDIENL